MNKLVWSVLGVLVIVPIAYSLFFQDPGSYWDDLMSNWLATMIGVGIGIPIALWLSRKQQASEEEVRREEAADEDRDRKAKVLSLLQGELRHNRDMLVNRVKMREKGHFVPIHRLKTTTWSTFSDGGELQWVRDLDLLEIMSTAYYYVYELTRIENLFMEVHYSATDWSRRRDARSEVDLTIDPTIATALEKTEQALQNIGVNLKST